MSENGLRTALRWALQEMYDDSSAPDGTPDHICEFVVNPPAGACRFHEKFWAAWVLAGLAIPEPDHSDDVYRGPRGQEADQEMRHTMNEARKLK